MTKGTLTVIAEIKAQPGKEEEVRKALTALVAPTHAEEGCIDYDLHESQDEPGHFFFYENWTGSAALNQHLESRHLKEFRGKAETLLSGPVKITRCMRIAGPKPKP